MSDLPTIGDLERRITIKLWRDNPSPDFSLDQSFTDPIQRWARIRPAGPMVHHASKQVGDGVTHYIDMRRDSKTAPEQLSTDKVIEHAGRRYRVLRAIDIEGKCLFTSVECTDIGPIED